MSIIWGVNGFVTGYGAEKMPDRRRRLIYAGRRIRIAALLVAVGVALVAADRFGVFGRRPVGDFAKYHNKTFRVARVIDGDTLDVDIPDEKYPHTRIRFWGVDTPETVKPNTPVQHFGPEASAFTKNACTGKSVRLELVDGKTRGKRGRVLAYVYLEDGRMLNRLLVAEGFAYADPRFDHAFKKEFRNLQKQAMQKGAGLWKDARREDLPYYHQQLKLPVATQPATR